MMRSKPPEPIRSSTLRVHRAVGNPDTFPVEVQIAGCGMAGSFLRASAGKERAMDDCELRVSGWIGDGDGKKAGIFVIYIIQSDVVKRSKCRKSQTLPVEEVPRVSEGDARTLRRICCVGHDVAPEWFYKGDARVLATTTAVGPSLIIGFGLEGNAEPLDAFRIPGFIEPDSCNADARVISFRDQSRKKVEVTIWATSGSRVQNTFDFLWVARLWLHQHSDAL